MSTSAGSSARPSPSPDSPSPSSTHIGVVRRGFGRCLRVSVLAVVLAVGLVVAPTLTAAAQPVSSDTTSLFTPDEDAYQPEVDENGLAQPTLDTSGIFESEQWIDVPGVDTDNDGNDDKVWAGVLLPNVPSGQKVPTVIHASPYRSGITCVLMHSVELPNGLWDPSQPREATTYGDWDRDKCYNTPAASREAALGLAQLDDAATVADDNQSERDYWLSRGFAYMEVATIGTYKSTGCPSMLDWREALGMKAVIDWLNGRQTAHDAADGGNLVSATGWSTGHVGMMGTSYDGMLPVLASTTGVDGLDAIIPISTVNNFYEYYRSGGAVRAPDGYPGEDLDNYITALRSDGDDSSCLQSTGAEALAFPGIDRQTGDYNDYWDARNLLTTTNKGTVGNSIDKVKAATLLVGGQNDFNAISSQTVQWYEGLRERGVSTELYLHNANHIDFFGSPRGSDFRNKSNQWFTHYLFGDTTWSPEGEDTYHVERVPDSGQYYGEWVSESAWPGESTGESVFYPSTGGDDGEDGTGDSDGLGGLQVGVRDGLGAFETLTDDKSVSEADIASSVAGDAAAANRLTYATGPAGEDLRIQGWPTATLGLAIDKRAANVSMLLVDRAPDGTAKVITRAWTDPQNRSSIWESEEVVPGVTYDLTLKFQPIDYVVPANHKLALVALSTDGNFSVHPQAGTKLTVDTSRTSLVLPVVGGQGAADTAFATQTVTGIAQATSNSDVARWQGADSSMFSVTATLSNGGTRILWPNEYTVEGFNPSVLGEQTVTIRYTAGGSDFTATASVNVVNNLARTFCANAAASSVQTLYGTYPATLTCNNDLSSSWSNWNTGDTDPWLSYMFDEARKLDSVTLVTQSSGEGAPESFTVSYLDVDGTTWKDSELPATTVNSTGGAETTADISALPPTQGIRLNLAYPSGSSYAKVAEVRIVEHAETVPMSTDTLVVRRGNHYFFKGSLSGGSADLVVAYGRPGDTALVGDWDGDGVDTLAVKRGNRYYIKNSLSGGAADTVVAYGKPSDTPLVGDWDGDGKDTLAIKRGKTYLIKNSLSGGEADRVVAYGMSSDTPLVGDWDGDGKDTLAIKRGNHYYLKNSLTGGVADRVFAYGNASDTALSGDWDGDGVDTLALRRGNVFHVKNSLSGGSADKVIAYGESSDSAALSGYWNL